MHFSRIFFPILGIIFCVSYLEAQKKSDISTINDYSHEHLKKHQKKHTKNALKTELLMAIDKNGKVIADSRYRKVNSNGNSSSTAEVDHTEEMLEENGTSI